MTDSWQRVYGELLDFISEHPEIKIEPERVVLPESVRPGFYRLFGKVRKTFIEQKIAPLLAEAQSLSKNYLEAEGEVIELLKLESVLQPKPVQWFLQDPADGLTRILFNPLFDLLKKELDIERFEEDSIHKLELSFRKLSVIMYQKWVAVSLIKLLKADKLLWVFLRQIEKSERTILASGSTQEPASYPQETGKLSFAHEPESLLTVPDFIIHSPVTGGFIAAKTEYRPAVATVSNTSQLREWLPLDSMVAPPPELILVYMAGGPTELSVTADAARICRPDIVVEPCVQGGWLKQGGFERAKSYHSGLKPALGTYVVFRDVLPQPEEKYEGISIINAGFERSGLEPIINALLKAKVSS